jgi:quercetin dioxygenase-like cupin family protein
MRVTSVKTAELLLRDYGLMKILVGGNKVKAKNLDLRILEIEPHMCTSKHYHAQSESVFYIMKGHIELETANGSYECREGNVLLVEPGEIHRIHNRGLEKSIILEVMAPPFSKSDIFFPDGTPMPIC